MTAKRASAFLITGWALALFVFLESDVVAQDHKVARSLTVEVGSELAGRVKGRLHAAPRGESSDNTKVDGGLTWELEIPGNVEIVLDRAAEWEIWAEAPGLWSPRLIVAWPEVQPFTRLELVAVGGIVARIALPRSSTPELSLSFEKQGPGSDVTAPKVDGTVECTIDTGRLSCSVPAGKLDLKLSGSGLVPVYRFGIEVGTDEATDLGVMRFVQGSSLIGWVEVSSGSPAKTNAMVRLQRWIPEGRLEVAEEKRLEKRSWVTEVDPTTGFFQMSGIEPGEYMIRFSQPGLAPARVGPMTIERGREHRLENVIRLFPPATLELILDPAFQPDGTPWELAAWRLTSGGEPESTTYGGTAQDGVIRLEGLAAGQYKVKIRDGRETWADRTVDLLPQGSIEVIAIPLLPVEGMVTLGEEPLEALLEFRYSNDTRRVRLHSDTAGEYEGYLPSAGDWKVLVEPSSDQVDVVRLNAGTKRVDPPRGRRATRLDIELPDTRINGQVVNGDGSAAQAHVKAWRNEERVSILGSVDTDDQGAFEIRGLSEGNTYVEAEGFLGETSDRAMVVLSEDLSSPELQLVLRKTVDLEGVVLASGQPVVGALVTVWPITREGIAANLFARTTTSGADGRFRLSLLSQAHQVIVTAPSHPIKISVITTEQVEGGRVNFHLAPLGGRLVFDAEGLAPSEEKDQGMMEEGLAMISHGNATVSLLAILSASSPVLDGARLILPSMEPGDYTICQKPLPTSQVTCQQEFVSPGGEVVVTFQP